MFYWVLIWFLTFVNIVKTVELSTHLNRERDGIQKFSITPSYSAMPVDSSSIKTNFAHIASSFIAKNKRLAAHGWLVNTAEDGYTANAKPNMADVKILNPLLALIAEMVLPPPFPFRHLRPSKKWLPTRNTTVLPFRNQTKWKWNQLRSIASFRIMRLLMRLHLSINSDDGFPLLKITHILSTTHIRFDESWQRLFKGATFLHEMRARKQLQQVGLGHHLHVAQSCKMFVLFPVKFVHL